MAKIDNIELSAVLKEEPKYTVAVTRHPVERGSQITDHAHPELFTLSVEAIVGEIADDGTLSQNPSLAVARLDTLFKKPAPIRVELPKGIYDPVVMTSWAPLYEARNGGALHFRAEFVEWKVVNTALAAVKKQGAQVKKGPAKQPEAPPEKKKSLAIQAAKSDVVQRGLQALNRVLGRHAGVQ